MFVFITKLAFYILFSQKPFFARNLSRNSCPIHAKNSRFLVREFFVLHEDFSFFAHFKRFLRHFGAFFANFASANDFLFCLLCSAKHTLLRNFFVKLFIGKPTFFYYFYARHAFFACLISLPTKNFFALF